MSRRAGGGPRRAPRGPWPLALTLLALAAIGAYLAWRAPRGGGSVPAPRAPGTARDAALAPTGAATADAGTDAGTGATADVPAAPTAPSAAPMAPAVARPRRAGRRDASAPTAPATTATTTPATPAAEPGPAEVSVRSSVFGYIRVDGGPEFPSPTPPLRLAPGAHRARVRYPSMGGAEADFTFQVSPGERRVIVVSPTGE